MFGEGNIYGQTSVSLDTKDRIILPVFTYAEPKDELLVINKEDYLYVCKEEKIENIVNNLEQKYIYSNLDEKKQIELELLKIYRAILKKVEVDKQRRLNLGGIDILDKKILCIGAKDSLILETKIRN